MDQLRRQFGDKFVKILSLCPTLVADLAEIRAAGVKIRKLGGRCQAYSNRDKRTIYIGARCSLSYKLISLAHEKVHVLVSPTPDPLPGITGKQAFVDMCLEAETDAIEHEVKAVAELLGANVKIDDHSMMWYRRWRRGGRAAIRRGIEKAYTSNTGELYPEYYGAWYDEALKPHHRLPLRHEHHGSQSCFPSVQLPAIKLNFGRSVFGNAAGNDICPRFYPPSCELPIELSLPDFNAKSRGEP